MRPVVRPGYLFNGIILLALVVLPVVCGYQTPHNIWWTIATVVTTVLSVLWLGRFIVLWVIWAAARMMGLGEKE